MLVVSAAVMLVMMAAIPFYMAKESAEIELLAKAERDLMQSKRIATVKADVEKIVTGVTPKIRQRIDFPDRFYTILVQMVSNNKHIWVNIIGIVKSNMLIFMVHSKFFYAVLKIRMYVELLEIVRNFIGINI